MIKEEFTISVKNYKEWIDIQKYMFQQNVGWIGSKFIMIDDKEYKWKWDNIFPIYISVKKENQIMFPYDDNYYMAFSTVYLIYDMPKKIIKASAILRKSKLEKLSS